MFFEGFRDVAVACLWIRQKVYVDMAIWDNLEMCFGISFWICGQSFADMAEAFLDITATWCISLFGFLGMTVPLVGYDH